MTDQPPTEIPAGTLAEARVEEMRAALEAAHNRNVQLNVEVRIRDAKIAELTTEVERLTAPEPTEET